MKFECKKKIERHDHPVRRAVVLSAGPKQPPQNRLEPEGCYSLGEHPDDTKSRRESMALAVVAVDQFAEDYEEELRALIWTYGDSLAQEKLGALRERFWGTGDYLKERT